MSDKKPFDVQSVNPRYGTAKMSDVARALLRPKDPKVRAALEKAQQEARGKAKS